MAEDNGMLYSQKTDNMELWEQVCETDPADTKPFTGKGGFKGTAIAAQTQRKRATELWGAFGTSWGIRNETFELIQLTDDYHDSIIAYSGELYYPDGQFGIHSDLDIWMYVKKGKYWAKNNDMRKKVRTDAFTKGLSELGFNADVFMGMFDDSKYVASLKNGNLQPEPIRKDQIKIIEQLIEETNSNGSKFDSYLKDTFAVLKIEDLSASGAGQLESTLNTKLDAQNA